jgi:hypothetical protein
MAKVEPKPAIALQLEQAEEHAQLRLIHAVRLELAPEMVIKGHGASSFHG